MAVINIITNDTLSSLRVVQGEVIYRMENQGDSSSLDPVWLVPESQDEALKISAKSGEEFNHLYLWSQEGEGGPQLYYSTTPQGTGHDIETIPSDPFGITFIMNLEGNTIIVGTVDTLIDPVFQTENLVLEN